MKFTDKYGPWALIAGASEGLGAAFAKELAKRGLNLMLIARRLEKLEVLSSEIQNEFKVKTQCYRVDLSQLEEITTFLNKIEVQIGLLVYNAALSPIGTFKDQSTEELLKATDVNIKAPLLLTKALSDKMIPKGKGGIVLMSSLAGLQGSPNIATYAATKAFNIILAEGLWKEYKGHNIDVMASVAGAITTPGYNMAKSQKTAPGTLSAEAVATKTIDALGKGPTVVPGRFNSFASTLMTRLIPQKSRILIMYNNTNDLI